MNIKRYGLLAASVVTAVGWFASYAVGAMAGVCEEFTGTVHAKMNIFGAGHPEVGDPPAPGGGNDQPYGGEWPTHIDLPAGQDRTVTFVSVDGATSPDGPQAINIGPDGSTSRASGDTSICSFNGISGILYEIAGGQPGKVMFLVGVFLDGSEPSGQAPTRLDFSADVETDPENSAYGEHFLELSPQLGQVFFIGDGLSETTTGIPQKFHVPNQATRLFLGFADTYNFGNSFTSDCDTQTGMCSGTPLPPGDSSCPGYYDDNFGELTFDLFIYEGEGDCNEDGTPDACDEDCQPNQESDICEILLGAEDCQPNGIPDECEQDCQPCPASVGIGETRRLSYTYWGVPDGGFFNGARATEFQRI